MLIKMKNKIHFIAALAALLMFASCSLEENLQSNYQTATYYRNYAQCVTGIRGCYPPLRSMYTGALMLATESVSDLMYCNSGTYDAILDISPANPRYGSTGWTQGYRGVMRCNNMIAALGRAYGDGNLTDQEYNELMAEAASLRGMFYYLLTSTFGDVPFYTCPIETAEDQDRIARMPRMSAVETRAYIVDELLELLPKDGVVQKRTYDNPESSDFRMGAAFGWMVCAKMAMWNACQDKVNKESWYAKALTALEHLEEIYGELNQYPLADIRFRNKYTLESIFEISNLYDEDGLKVTKDQACYFTPYRAVQADVEEGKTAQVWYSGLVIEELGTNARTYNAYRPNKYFYQQLQPYTDYDKLDENDPEFINNTFDHRSKINMAWGYKALNDETGKVEWQFFYNVADGKRGNQYTKDSRPWMGDKFWCPNMQSTSDGNNYNVFRYAGALIMAAECHLELGNRTKAIEYLNKVRSRAGLGTLNPANFKSPVVILNEIQKEHGRELIGEFQRKFELVRWGIWYEQVLNCSDYTTLKNNILPCHEYYPIPDREVALSGGALTNTEYEKYNR